ncbi:MAG: N-acetylmuramoyl-L-alanine amidase, partial [Sporichthyaceae bacterium]|nr:N-acetylmuramoyl-L-alanine amidase [Sporichthyaceae bacterium]
MAYLDDLRAEGLQIASRAGWGSRFNYSSPRTVYLPGRYLFLHIAVVNDPNDLKGSEDDVVRTIEQIGIQRFPSTGISYNAIAFDTGRLYDGQPLTRRGAHTINDFGISGYPYNLNYYGHAIVLPQQTADAVTDAQVDAVARWGAAVVRAGYSRASQFFPHRKFSPKECPGDRAVARLDDINRLLRHYIAEGLDEMPTAQEVWAHGLVVPGTDNKVTAGGMLRSTYSDVRNIKARVGAMEAVLAELLAKHEAGDTLTIEEIRAASKAGAEEALTEGIDLRISVDD